MIRNEIESMETTPPNLLKEQTEQLKRIFPQAFSEGNLILIQLKANFNYILGKQRQCR
jgi:hypothetical protein